MLYLRSVESIISLLTLVIAYIIGITTAGYAEAWLAKKNGDDTAEQAGFLTWNPLVHIDPFGAICLLMIGIGWGKFIPINHLNIKNRLSLFIVYLAQGFTHLIVALAALIVLLSMFGPDILPLTTKMVLTGYISLGHLTSIYPTSSSLFLALALILTVIIYFSALFAALDGISGLFRFIMVEIFFARDPLKEGDFIISLVPLLLMMAFANPLRYYLIYGISKVGYFLAHMVGA